ncbi:MAG TPA: hypothetical protein VGL84_06010 [Gaiellaceae bacterium]|jgi:hypothetical protein
MSRFRITPALGVAVVALFFAVGGSAFAFASKTAPQIHCGVGSVRGVATVVGLPKKGVGNIADTFSSNAQLFSQRFNCGGGAISVLRLDTGVYQVLFAKNPAATAVASATSDDGASASVSRQTNGSFQVTIWGHETKTNAPVPEDADFTVVLF